MSYPRLIVRGRKAAAGRGRLRRALAALAIGALCTALPLLGAQKVDPTCVICHVSTDKTAADTGLPLAVSEPHQSMACQECHSHELSPRFHNGAAPSSARLNQLLALTADELRLSEEQLIKANVRCKNCHDTQFKEWQGSAHAMTYADSFLNRQHNQIEQPMNDCLRCHAMFFEGTIEELVKPLDTQGPWKMVKPELAGRFSILCSTCHQIHPHENNVPPQAAGKSKAPVKNGSASPSKTIGFYDRREKQFFGLAELPHPKIHLGTNLVAVSPDPRIRTCYQCHAPDATHQAGTSDDRTPRGVHAGLSCFDCHGMHALKAGNSCARCHPRDSHCKLEVARMDTTARSAASPHDIHTVGCTDCHPQGRPK